MDKENPDAKRLPPVIIRPVNCHTVHIDVRMRIGELSPEILRQLADWMEASERKGRKYGQRGQGN